LTVRDTGTMRCLNVITGKKGKATNLQGKRETSLVGGREQAERKTTTKQRSKKKVGVKPTRGTHDNRNCNGAFFLRTRIEAKRKRNTNCLFLDNQRVSYKKRVSITS